MQVNEVKNDGLSREFSITIAAADIDRLVEDRLNEVGQSVSLPGFRPGKVPMAILKQRFGNSVLGEVLEKAVNETSQEALTERDLRPAMQPKIEISSFEQGADLVYTMNVEIMPEIAPVDFSTIEATRYKVDISDSEVDEALNQVASENRQTEKVEEDRKTKSGDVVVIDFKGSVDGVEFEGGAAEDFRLELGSGRFIPGFEDQLIGHKAGSDVKVEVKFPEDYGAADLAGKDAVFETKIKEVHAYVDSELDDEFAKSLGLDSLDDLKNNIRRQLESNYEEFARSRTKRELLDALYATHDFEVPPGMVETEFQEIWNQFEQARQHGQVDEEDKEKSDDELQEEYRKIAHRRVLLGLLLSHIGEKAEVQVTQEELQQAVLREARRHPGQERQIFEAYSKSPEAMASLRAPIFEEKTVDHILDQASVSDKALPVDALLDMGEPSAEDKSSKKASSKKSAAKKSEGKKAAAKKSASKKAASKKAAAKKD